MLALKQFRSKTAGLPDLLNYAALIDEGIVIGKDGSLLAGFFFRGDDWAVMTNADRNYITALVNTYLARFDSGWAFWVDAIRVPSPGYPSPDSCHYPDPICALIDEERRQTFSRADTHYETEYAMVVQYLPPLRRESKLMELVYTDEGQESGTPGDRILKDFKRRVADLSDGLSGLLHMRRMGTITVASLDGEQYESDELVNYLHFCLTGEPIALRIPSIPMYLDAWIGARELWPGDTPRLGDKFIAAISIEGFPGVTVPGLLNLLSDGLPMAYRWSTRFIFVDQHEAISALNRYRLKWQQKVRGFWSQVFKKGGGGGGMINTDAVEMMQDSERAMSEAQSGLVAYGYYSPVITLMHSDRQILEEACRYIRREVERKGFAARVETVNCLEAWLGTLPGHPYPNVRRPLIHSLNLADLLPLHSIWPGLRECPCPFYPPDSPPLMQVVTAGSTPFRLNLHVGDVGHTLVFGPTGAGKSTLLATLLAQARRYKDMTITAFDKGRSLYALCSAVAGGIHYDIGSDDAPISLAPLADIDNESAILWAEEWVETCFELQAGHPPTPQQKREIHRAMTLLRSAPREFRSLTDFVTTVQDDEIRAALGHYTIAGPMGYLLDGKSDSVSMSPFTVFEIDELMRLGDRNAIPVLLYLFRRFDLSLHGQPAILSLDEAWVMLGHKVFREKLREWLKELRKKNCLVLLATQSLSDAVSSGLLDVLLEQCPTKILLPNKEADLRGTKEYPGPGDLYRTFGLNDKEIELLKNSQYKKHYYYKSPLGRRQFELALGPLALAFVAVSDKESIATIKQLQQSYGQDWPLIWLQQRGVDYAQYLSA